MQSEPPTNPTHRIVAAVAGLLIAASSVFPIHAAGKMDAAAEELLAPLQPTAAPTTGKAARVARMAVRTEQLHRGTLRLTMPNGRVLAVIRDQIEDHGNGDLVWKGRIAGEPLSRATFVLHNGVVSGVVDRALEKGNELYEITPSPSGGYIVSQVDDTHSMACGHEHIQGIRLPEAQAQKNSRKNPSGSTSAAVVRDAVGNIQVDIMVVYTPATRVRYGKAGIEAKILQAVSDANTGFANSLVNVSYNLVYMGEVAYTETGDMAVALSSLCAPSDGKADEVHAIRESVGADLVSLVDEDSNYGGIGYAMTSVSTSFAAYGFSVVYSGALSQLSLSHELAHNMGCQHDRSNAGYQAAFPYSYGWRKCATDGSGFRTVMSYACSGVPRINYLSSPQLSYLGSPLGVDYGVDPANAADNARTIRETAATVAAFRATVASVTTVAPSAPVAPTGLTATAASATTVTLSWLDQSSNETAFIVERSTDGANFVVAATLASNVTSYSDGGRLPSTAYWYRVSASSSAGKSTCATTASVTTPALPAPPAAPTALVATSLSTSQIGLSWVDNATNETGYTVEYSANGTTYSVAANLGAGAVSYTCAGLNPGTTYSFRVLAKNSTGNSAYCTPASASTLQAAPPAPTRLSLTAVSASQINLSWTDNASNESGFRIQRSTDGTTFTEIATAGANTKAFSNTGLKANTLYYYRVCAYNSAGNSAWTSACSIRTKK